LHCGNGVISVISNLIPHEFGLVINDAISGNRDAALKKFSQIKNLVEAIFIESNPIPVKWLLATVGIISSPYVRLPLTVLSEKCRLEVVHTLTKFRAE